MENNTIPVVNMGDLLSGLFDFFKAVWLSRKQAFFLLMISLLLSASYFIIQKPKYEAKTSFILEEKGAGVGGSLSGLASQFGVDIGSLSGGAGLFAGDNILDIIKSRNIIEKVLLSKIDSTSEKNKNTLADEYLNWSKLKTKWSGNPYLAQINFTDCNPGKDNSRLQDSVLLVIVQKLVKKNVNVERLNKKGSIIEVTVVSPSENFSKLFSERLVSETIKLWLDIKTGTAVKNIRRLEQRSDSLMEVLNTKSFKSASLQVLDANIAYKSAAVPVEVTQRDKTVTYALYTEVMKNLEASRMALAGQTPIINMLDRPKLPLEDQKYSFWMLLLLAAAGAFLIHFVFVFVSYAPKSKSVS